MYLFDTISRQAIEVVQVDRGSGLVLVRPLEAHPGDAIRAPLGLLENAMRTCHLVPLKEAYVALLGKKASMREARRLAFYEQLLRLNSKSSIDLTSLPALETGPRRGTNAYLDALRVLPRTSPSIATPNTRGRRRAR